MAAIRRLLWAFLRDALMMVVSLGAPDKLAEGFAGFALVVAWMGIAALIADAIPFALGAAGVTAGLLVGWWFASERRKDALRTSPD